MGKSQERLSNLYRILASIAAMSLLIPVAIYFFNIELINSILNSDYSSPVFNTLILIASIFLYANSRINHYGEKNVANIATLLLLIFSTISMYGDIVKMLNDNGPDHWYKTLTAIALYVIIFISYLFLAIRLNKLRKKSNSSNTE
ncbi:hypothetical protein ABN220_01200 [Proteus cibi]|uniref:hypothetical protein n=1 Tax=Proteus TaxID=583 RepID=UPI003075E774